MLKMLFIGAIFLIFFGWTVNSSAQDKTEDYSRWKIDSYLRYIPSRSVDAMSGKVEIIESESEYSYELNPVREKTPKVSDGYLRQPVSNGVKAFDKLPVKFSLDTKYISIEDTVGVELPSHLTGVSGDIETTLPFFKFNETYLRLGISPSFYGDDWDFEASNFRLPSRYFLIHRPNERLTLITGVAIYPDFENEVWPILGFIYQPNDRLTFNIVPRRPEISYLLNDRVTLFATGGSTFSSEFEVTRDNAKNVVLRYKETYLGSGIKLKFNRFIQGSISAGGIFNRSLKYRDNQGKVNIKDGLYTEVRIEVAW